MQMEIARDIEKVTRTKLTIGQRQQIINAINLYREAVRNADANMIQIITRRLSIPQNEFTDTAMIEFKAIEYLKRPLSGEEITFLRQTSAVRKNSVLQIQTVFINKLTALTRLQPPELEAILKRHNITFNAY